MSVAESFQGTKKPILVRADDRSRVPLAKLGAKPDDEFTAEKLPDGRIVLAKMVRIPERELLVWQDQELLGSVMRGLAQASSGEAVSDPEFEAELDAVQEDW
jgi:hypothetical protein